MSKSHRPLRAVVLCFNMAARTNRTSIIRERNERGFRNFLQNLKAVFHLFLNPDNKQLTTDALRDARQYLLEAKGTLSRMSLAFLFSMPLSVKFHLASSNATLIQSELIRMFFITYDKRKRSFCSLRAKTLLI